MSFRDNLQHLRATRNMTQEQLAMLLGVSRQAVGKWEAERAYPEMDKLLKMCDIFGCTLDELVTGDLTGREPEPELSVAPGAVPTDVTGYDEVMLRFAQRTAIGVGLCIFGLGLGGLVSDGVWFNRTFELVNPVVPIIGFLAFGLLFILPAAFEREACAKAHPFLINFYTPEQVVADKGLRGKQLAAGICLILLGLVAQSLFPYDEGAATCAFFSCLAPGVGVVVYAGLALGRLNIEEYNDDNLGDLTDAEIDALGDASAAERARAMKREGYLYGTIMLGATALGLIMLFEGIAMDWDFLMPIFWLPWPIGGITCGIIACIRRMRG